MRKGTLIYKRLAKIRPGSTVAKLIEAGTVSRFDIACHWPRGRIVVDGHGFRRLARHMPLIQPRFSLCWRS